MDDNTKVLNKNGYDEDGRSKQDDENDDLTATECKAFRMLAARSNYMAQDHVSLQFSAKEICRSMANPKANDFWYWLCGGCTTCDTVLHRAAECGPTGTAAI